MVPPSHLKTLKRTRKYFVEATPVPHFQFLKNLSIYIYKYIICKYLCTWILTHPKTSTEWGTYSFSHAPTTKSGTCPCTPLQALRLSKKRFWRTSTESGTCHKSSRRFSLKNKGAQSFFWGCTFMIFRNTKTSTEWGTYSFSHAPTTKSGTCPCTPLQALRLSKKMVLTDLYRIRNLPQI